jgi:hypothetical protein
MIDKELFVYNIDFYHDRFEYHSDNLVNPSMYKDNNERNNKYHHHLEIYMSK